MEKSNLSFIHSSLDDYGLTPSQFRVYCHVARVTGENGVCYQSLKTIADCCGLTHWTVRPILGFLVKANLLSMTYVNGDTNNYQRTLPADWLPLGIFARGSKKTEGKISNGRGIDKSKGNPSEKTIPKVTPIEVTPIKPRARFQIPTLDTVKELMAKDGLPEIEAQKFFNHYSSNGWRVGKNPMRSLSHSITNWKLRRGEYKKPIVHTSGNY